MAQQRSAQYALEGALINYAHGDLAYGDLDAIKAALTATGGVGSEALMQWDTFAALDKLFALLGR